MIVTWAAPDDAGSPITGFILTFRKSDESTFSPELVNCDMTSSTDVTCTLPVSVLKAEPFSLPWGASVFAKVVATNAYGNSVESLSGNGAVITVTPDPPTDLNEDYSQRTKSTLAFTWLAPVFTGGAVIIDYRVSIAEQGQAFTTLASGVTDLTYKATGLTFGTTYEFKVEARNSYSYSGYSDVLTMLCAFKPDPPLTVTTENVNELVKVAWDEPIANGSPITGFRILVLEHDGVTYTQESEQCDGTDATIISTRICFITLQSLRAEPYLLVKDNSVHVKIISENFYGDSVESVAGNGAVI